MSIDDFARDSKVLHALTVDFVRVAIHHGQWSIYAALAGFDTPLSWRTSWGL